jgi:glycosyltransferase involved in cell wall biosynthesis
MGQGTGLAGRAPSFSVVVPTRNGPGQLAECLASLAAQDYPADRFEVVVVDDGSDPPIRSVARSFEHGRSTSAANGAVRQPGWMRRRAARWRRLNGNGRRRMFRDDARSA